MAREKEKDEEFELRSMSFKPACQMKPEENSIIAPFNADVIDRNQKWAQRRDEKLSRLKTDHEKSVEATCSFKPNIVIYFQADTARKRTPRRGLSLLQQRLCSRWHQELLH